MPFTNFESRHFTAAEEAAIQQALNVLETALASKLANLSAEERSKYGSVNEQNKLIINKVKDYHDRQPTLSSPDIDWQEYDRDFRSRSVLEGVLARLDSLMKGVESAKILHDYDNYQAALTDYDYTKYKAGTKAIGFETKMNEIKQFFNRTNTTNENTPPNP